MSTLTSAINDELAKLNGTDASVIAMMTGLTVAEVNELGGTP